ncbi:hypothetical protein [Brevibacillus laterosporus]|uniref:hypothetical protein n=1 Tax=Brevibacillus laterosporus TaxID=1465 RepID=UPI002650CF0C|nr:hypothetical protein [Brevibacillus laterosporus]MDN9009044.1 hypothetical protein [Brevibacillus laterosporus]MDO0942497.1 hypothetical protein [Brevibacillus laterosporus]
MILLLDNLCKQITSSFGGDTYFMGLAFRFKKGIVMTDLYVNSQQTAEYTIEFVSFIEHEPPVYVKSKEELYRVIQEFAM